MLHFAHWIPLIDQTQPLFSIARHTGVIQPPEHRVEVNGLEIAPGQSRGLSFDNQFTISLDFEAVSLEKGMQKMKRRPQRRTNLNMQIKNETPATDPIHLTTPKVEKR